MPKKARRPAPRKGKSRARTVSATTAGSTSAAVASSAKAPETCAAPSGAGSSESKSGRPTIYTPELAEQVCKRLSSGESLRQICRDEDMPDRDTVREWALKDREGFSGQYARAREAQAESFLDEIIEIVDDGRNDWIDREVAGGRTIRVIDQEAVMRSKLRFEARRWAMSKILPKKYGEAVLLKGDKDNPLELNVAGVIVVPKKDVSSAAPSAVAAEPAPG